MPIFSGKMEQKDYLMRYIEQLGKVLAYLLGFREKGDSKGGLEVIDEALKDMTRMDSAEINAIPEERLVKELCTERKLLPQQVKVIAELLFREGEFLETGKDPEQVLKRYRKSLLLLQYMDEVEKTYSLERIQRIRLLEDRIKEG
jgi:hypothetical protein